MGRWLLIARPESTKSQHGCLDAAAAAAKLLRPCCLNPVVSAGGGGLAQHPGSWDFVRQCAAAMKQEACGGGRVLMYLGGECLASGATDSAVVAGGGGRAQRCCYPQTLWQYSMLNILVPIMGLLH